MTIRNKRTAKQRAAFPIEEEHDSVLPQGVSPACYAQNRRRLSVLLIRFLTLRLRNLYQAFDGDLTMCLVLGEIATRNTERFFDARNPNGQDPDYKDFLPCNALSISEVTGIPRETVRRKLSKLIKLGWVVKSSRDKYIVADNLHNIFAAFEDTQTFDLLQTSHKINELLQIEK